MLWLAVFVLVAGIIVKSAAFQLPPFLRGTGGWIFIVLSAFLALADFLDRKDHWTGLDSVVLMAYLALLLVAVFAKPSPAR